VIYLEIVFGEIHGVNTRWLHWVMLHFHIWREQKHCSSCKKKKKENVYIYGVYRKSL